MSESPSDAVLTITEICARVLDLQEDERQYALIGDRIPLKKKWIDAAMTFVTDEQRRFINDCSSRPAAPPPPLPRAPSPPRVPSPPPQSARNASSGVELFPPLTLGGNEEDAESQSYNYSSYIRSVLKSAGEFGASHDELTDGILETNLHEHFNESPKAFQNALSRMNMAGEITKMAGVWYLSATAQNHMDRGMVPRVVEEIPRARSQGGPGIVLRLLQGHEIGMTAVEIKEAVAELEDAPESFRKYRHYIYSVLKSLERSNDIQKIGEYYVATPEKAKAASGQD